MNGKRGALPRRRPPRIVMFAATVEMALGGLACALVLLPVLRSAVSGSEIAGGTMAERWTLLGNACAALLGAVHIANGIGVWRLRRWAWSGLLVLLPSGAILHMFACVVTIWLDITDRAWIWDWGTMPDMGSVATVRVGAYFAMALGTVIVA